MSNYPSKDNNNQARAVRAGAAVPGCATRIARRYGSAGVVRSAESRQSKLGLLISVDINSGGWCAKLGHPLSVWLALAVVQCSTLLSSCRAL